MITSGFLHGLIELIDTQWDVNVEEPEEPDEPIGINRYIVGCK